MNDLIVDLENYRIIKKVGEGSYGKVYLVQDIQTNEQLVAKESKVECQTTKDQKSFFNEITAFSKVHNPAVLSLIGFNMTNFEGDHYPTILTEYMPNGSLDKLFKENADFSSSEKYIILLGIAKGMECLHEHGIIHRDLKPANILLDENFYPRICDFGESVVSELTISSILMESYKGTPAYMAPEVFSDDSYTYKADVFSFSIIMYQILTGKEPFPKIKSVFNLQSEIEKGKRPDLTFIKDESIKIFLNKCWSSNPNERPDFKEILKEIQNEKYMKAMSVNRTDVSNYLKLFDSKIESKDIKNTTTVTKNTKDPQKWKMEADKGDPKAMFFYGCKLDHGKDGVMENKKEASRYYKMAADKGHVNGMFRYSYLLFHMNDPENAESNQKEALRDQQQYVVLKSTQTVYDSFLVFYNSSHSFLFCSSSCFSDYFLHFYLSLITNEKKYS